MDAPIILATDLTARSDRAFARAVQLARQWQRRLVVVHVLEKVAANLQGAVRGQTELVLADLVAGLDIPHETLIEAGSLPETIGQLAESLQASAIVVGAARYNHVTDFVLGTAVDHLARHSSVPVLIVKDLVKGPYDGLVAGTDFSDRSKEALIDAACLFPELPIKVAHGYPRPFPGRIGLEEARIYGEEKASQEMAAFLADADIVPLAGRIEARFAQMPASEAIGRIATELRQPLVILGGRGRGALLQALLGNRTSELVAIVPHDVLIVRRTAIPAGSE